jgi:TetR/AcrR family tetracycline transcriptional repressor
LRPGPRLPDANESNGYSVSVIIEGSRTDSGDRVTSSSPNTEKKRPPAGPRPPGRPAIPLDRVLATALRIVDEQGADALSMRTLAQRLGSGTATLYRHYASRAHLVAQVVDQVLGEVVVEPDALAGLGWQPACATLARATFDTLARHPRVAPLLAEQVPVGPHAMAHRERLVATLLAHGFPPRLAALAYATLARHVLGFAIQLRAERPADGQPAATFRRLSRAQFPATVAVAGFLPVPLDEEFDFGLRLILGGLERVLAAGAQNR